MRRVLPLALFFSLVWSALAPVGAEVAPSLAWESQVDSHPELGGLGYDVMNAVKSASDGGCVVAGYTIPRFFDRLPQEAFVVRFDAAGGELWRAHLGDGEEDYEAASIHGTDDGGWIVAARAFTPFPIGSPVIFYSTSFVSKLDGTGAEQWRYGFDHADMDEIGGVAPTSDGGYLAVGRVWKGMTATAIAKLDGEGNLLWVRHAEPDDQGEVGPMLVTSDGGVLTALPRAHRMIVKKFGADAALQWSSTMEGVDGALLYEKDAHELHENGDGTYLLVGAFREATSARYGRYRGFSARFDARGRQSELVAFGEADWVHAVARATDGGYVAAEGISGSAGTVVVKYSPAGAELWRSMYGSGPERVHLGDIESGPDGSLVMAGTVEVPGVFPRDGYALKLAGRPAGSGVSVAIDVKPGSDDNPVNPCGMGVLPVGVLSAGEFNALSVDPATVELAGASVLQTRRGRFQAKAEDVNRDGRADLLLLFSPTALQLPPSATEVSLTGRTFDGAAVEGTDSIKIVGRNCRSK